VFRLAYLAWLSQLLDDLCFSVAQNYFKPNASLTIILKLVKERTERMTECVLIAEWNGVEWFVKTGMSLTSLQSVLCASGSGPWHSE